MKAGDLGIGFKAASGDCRDEGLPVFLVLEREALIADDIIGSLRDIGPCRIIHVDQPEDIEPGLQGEDQLAAAFLELRHDAVRAHGLDERLSALGAWIILTVGEDDQPIVQALGWGMLVRPFSDQMIRDLIRQMGRRV